jgi:hypothetical protein
MRNTAGVFFEGLFVGFRSLHEAELFKIVVAPVEQRALGHGGTGREKQHGGQGNGTKNGCSHLDQK